MQKVVDSERPGTRSGGRGRWGRWALAVGAVLVLAGVAGLVRIGMAGPEQPGALAGRLADQVVEVLEEATRDQHADHGHHFEADFQGLVCVASTFGYDPPDATEVAQVRSVYADHACAELGTPFSWPQVVRSTGPLAVELTTDPATVLLPSQALPGDTGALFADRIRAVIPAEYHRAALAHESFTDPDLLHELEKRYAAAR